MCLFNSRDRENQYVKITRPARKSFAAGSKNIIHDPSLPVEKVLLPPLHIKLGLMKQLVKALNTDGYAFKYIRGKFAKKTDAKVTAGVFDGPEIRRLLRDPDFIKL